MKFVYKQVEALTCDGRGLDDGGRAEEGRSVSGGDRGVEVPQGGLRALRLRVLLGPGGRDGRPAALLRHSPGVETGLEAEEVEVVCRRGGGLCEQEAVGVWRESL